MTVQALVEAGEHERAVSLPLDEQLRQLPDAPGVYTFYDARGSLLYVGNISSARITNRWLFVEISPPHRRPCFDWAIRGDGH